MRGIVACAGAVLLAALWATPAPASTSLLGAVSSVESGRDPYPGFNTTSSNDSRNVLQAAQSDNRSPGQYGYVVPPGYGVITQWSHATDTVHSGQLTLTMWQKIASGPSAGQYLAVATDREQVVANQIHHFNVRIPVTPGQYLGLSSETLPFDSDFDLGYQENDDNVLGVLTDNAVNGDPQPASPKKGFVLDLAARVETDADGDGYGDDTQDGCPTRADIHTGCPAGAGGGTDKVKPKVAGLKLSAAVFRAAGSGPAFVARARVGTGVTFRVSEAATMRFGVKRRAGGRKVGRKCKAPRRSNRGHKRCVRYATVKGSFSLAAKPGTNAFTFRGRIGGRRLRPGRYRLEGRATDKAHNRSSVVRAAFRIVR
jgi:hypothetical protein